MGIRIRSRLVRHNDLRLQHQPRFFISFLDRKVQIIKGFFDQYNEIYSHFTKAKIDYIAIETVHDFFEDLKELLCIEEIS